MEFQDADFNEFVSRKGNRRTIPSASKDLANFLVESGELSLEICKVLEGKDTVSAKMIVI